MSIEEALNRHSDALLALAGALKEGQGILATMNAGGGKTATARAATPGKPAAAATGQTAGQAGATTGAASAASPASPTVPAQAGERIIKYEELREAFMKLGEVKGNTVAVGVLTTMGVKTGKDIPPANYAKFKDEIKKVMPEAVWNTLSLSK
jgi:hypothetical protein